jgi:hypothetical protein
LERRSVVVTIEKVHSFILSNVMILAEYLAHTIQESIDDRRVDRDEKEANILNGFIVVGLDKGPRSWR